MEPRSNAYKQPDVPRNAPMHPNNFISPSPNASSLTKHSAMLATRNKLPAPTHMPMKLPLTASKVFCESCICG